MKRAIDRLRSLRVGDVMARDVVCLAEELPLRRASQILANHGLAGAPVVDSAHRCIGILSGTDLLRREAARPPQENETATARGSIGSGTRSGNPSANPGGECVRRLMTPTVQTVSPHESLLKAAVIMSTEHVHRLPVIDHRGELVGMISTMDVVSAMINAVEEIDGPIISTRRPEALGYSR